jgi:putative copper resistance protein D
MYHASVTLHLLAAIFWLGGMFFLGIVGAPALAGLDTDLRRRLFKEIGLRFRGPGWVAIAVLVTTGIVNLRFRGLLAPALHGGLDFWLTPIGKILAWKLGLVLAMVTIGAAHDFWLGPLAGKLASGSKGQIRVRTLVSRLGRLNAVLGILVVYFATRLIRG